jgi:ABC-2 type transport system ATP-binding protein
MIAIRVNDVNKKFKIYYDKGQSFKEKLLFQNRNYHENRWVLRGVSFEVKRGEAVGIIGENGCGKSTLLKLLSRIMYPDSGSIEIQGRVSSLIELGAGFHPDMSGRENIYTNAAIFGLTRPEIDHRLESIIEFSELQEFIDNPVRTYSSGMYMRLAFSVAINVDADVLLIDEILAVGDVNFQAKCFNKLREIKGEGTTIVLVSHSLAQIEQICDKTIWIQDGLIKLEGEPRNVHTEYIDFMGHRRQEAIEKKEKTIAAEHQASETDSEPSSEETDGKISRTGNGKARITSISSYNSELNEQSVFRTGEFIKLKVEYHVHENINDAVFGIAVYRNDGVHCYGVNTKIDYLNEFTIKENGFFEIDLKRVTLLPGSYTFDIAIEEQDGIPVDYFRNAYRIEMYSPINDVGMLRIEHEWIF